MTAHDDFCLVTIQDGDEFVSTVRLSEDDSESFLAVEALLHRAFGWRVVEGLNVLVARRGSVVRIVRARPVVRDWLGQGVSPRRGATGGLVRQSRPAAGAR